MSITVLNSQGEHIVLNHWQREIYNAILRKLSKRKNYFASKDSVSAICGIHHVLFQTRTDNDHFWYVTIKADDYYVKHANGYYEHVSHPDLHWFIQK